MLNWLQLKYGDGGFFMHSILEGFPMGAVTDIQQQLRKGDALRINYSALQKL